MSIPALASAYRRGVITPEQVVERCLRASRSAQRHLHAWEKLNAEGARQAAKVATQEMAAGIWRGPLHGVPYGLKDIIHVHGHMTTAGVAGHEIWPEETADIVCRLQRAGAILLGKTRTAELAAGATGVNLPIGTPINPHCASVAPGGSSSGSAVAVAAGSAPLSHTLAPLAHASYTCPACCATCRSALAQGASSCLQVSPALQSAATRAARCGFQPRGAAWLGFVHPSRCGRARRRYG
jgi:Asp-tRNA(Asn)/Glu-tRNA(Gln) amidotransferase A subunit family amidase